MYKHILVPTDGSKLSLKAAKAAARLAKSLKAKITALHVIAPYAPPYGGEDMIFYAEAYSPQQYKKATEVAATRALAKVEAAAKALKVPCAKVFLVGGQPWNVIVRTARAKKCDLIVMSSHGRHGLVGVLIGSETTKVLTHSRIPVLVCR
jgi:nucleotide-binding universal stress UspA family protein